MPPTSVESFEIKVNFRPPDIDKAMEVFGIDPAAAEERRIWFGEVVDGRDGRDALPLLARGGILRVRAKRKSGGDVTLKLRGPDGGIDVGAWTGATAGLDTKVQGDWAGRRLVSASVTSKFDDAVPAGSTPPLTLVAPAQRNLAQRLLIPLDGVTLLGPVAARKWDAEGEDGVAAELWTVDDLTFLEISAVTKDDPEHEQEKLWERAEKGGLTVDKKGDPKTTIVLRALATR